MCLKQLFDKLQSQYWNLIKGGARSLRWAPVAIALLLMPITQTTHAQVITDDEVWLVDQDAGDDGNSGQDDWENALETIEEALSRVSAGDEIWVAASASPYLPTALYDPNTSITVTGFATPCTCDENGKRATFRLVKNVSLYGGFLGNAHPSGGETTRSQADPANNITTLSGDLGHGTRAHHVLVYFQPVTDATPASLEMIIDGFVITGGSATGGFEDEGQLNTVGGGALVVYETHELDLPLGPVFSRCSFVDNTASFGGGAYAGIYAGGRFVDCRFENNTHIGDSDALFGKTTQGGGAVNLQGPVVILTSTFIENTSDSVGGAVYNDGAVGAEPGDVYLISNSKFYANEAPNGAAISETNAKIINCEFRGNRTPTAGGNPVPRH